MISITQRLEIIEFKTKILPRVCANLNANALEPVLPASTITAYTIFDSVWLL